MRVAILGFWRSYPGPAQPMLPRVKHALIEAALATICWVLALLYPVALVAGYVAIAWAMSGF